jgi:hypothetical protein
MAYWEEDTCYGTDPNEKPEKGKAIGQAENDYERDERRE